MGPAGLPLDEERPQRCTVCIGQDRRAGRPASDRVSLRSLVLQSRRRKIEWMSGTRTAKEYLVDLFDGEEIMHVGLEEVVFDETSNCWGITIGFSRPWDRNTRPTALIAAIGDRRLPRSYKVIRVVDDDGRVVSLTDRVLPASRLANTAERDVHRR